MIPHTSTKTALAIVIPCHNRRDVTRECLDCLAGQTDPDFQTVVVDDGSSDGTREMIRSRFPRVILLPGDGNLWWTAATNLGIRRALDEGAGAVMTLNDDTLPAPGFVAHMKEAAAAHPRGLIGAMSVHAETGTPAYWGERVFWPTAGYRPLPFPRASPPRGLHAVTHFPGRGLLIPAAVFKAIGLFDEKRFPHYAADYDFTLRAGRAGFDVLCNYDAPLRIHAGKSGGGELMSQRSWTHYRRHLTGLKGVGNLRVFFRYTVRNCPGRWLPLSLFCGTIRRLFGYPAHWCLEWARRLK
jgi:GT2 family glycosyltransferase